MSGVFLLSFFSCRVRCDRSTHGTASNQGGSYVSTWSLHIAMLTPADTDVLELGPAWNELSALVVIHG